MADTKISDLTAVDALTVEDVFAVVDATDSLTKKATLADVENLFHSEDVEVFTDLSDVPEDYTDAAGKSVVVNAEGTGLEFAAPVEAFTDLSDVPVSYAGKAAYKVVVNNTEDGLAFANGDAYGAMYVSDNTTPQAITTSWTVFTPIGAQLCTSKNVSVNPATGEMTILEAGVYNVFLGLSFLGGNNVTFDFAVFKNGVIAPSTRFTRKMGTAGDIGVGAALGLCVLAIGDVLDTRVKSSVNTPLTMQHGQFNIHKVD